MQSLNDNIYPIFNQIISKREKENRLKQNAKCIWLTGLSGSGKTTLALKLEKTLFKQGFLVQILDGDNIRTGISNNLDFSENDRLENIRRIAEVSKLFINCGIITINCFVSPSNKIRLQADLSEKKSTYNIGVTEPYFLDRHLSLYGDIFNQETENKKGDIKSSSSGFGFGIGFTNDSLSQNFKYKLSTSETTTSSTSTAASETGEEGIEIITSSITHSISKDTRDSYFNPTSGYSWKFSNTVAGIGGDATFYKSILNSRIYYPIDYGDYVFGFKSGVGFITAIDDKITSSNRFFLGGKKLRGFDNGGLGPRDTGNNQAVGGNNFYNFSFELKSKKFMPEDTGLEWLVFSDIGSIWGTDYETNVKGFDDIEPRITNGFGLAMVTPIGPLQMIWGFPVQSQDYDIEENFQFSIGTSF